MTQATVTPQTQVLSEGKLTRDELKSLMQRSDGPAMGRLSDTETRFIPKVEQIPVFRDARIMLGIYALIFAGIAITGWSGLIWYWIVPLLLGEPVTRFIRMTEHVGRTTVA